MRKKELVSKAEKGQSVARVMLREKENGTGLPCATLFARAKLTEIVVSIIARYKISVTLCHVDE